MSVLKDINIISTEYLKNIWLDVLLPFFLEWSKRCIFFNFFSGIISRIFFIISQENFYLIICSIILVTVMLKLIIKNWFRNQIIFIILQHSQTFYKTKTHTQADPFRKPGCKTGFYPGGLIQRIQYDQYSNKKRQNQVIINC